MDMVITDLIMEAETVMIMNVRGVIIIGITRSMS